MCADAYRFEIPAVINFANFSARAHALMAPRDISFYALRALCALWWRKGRREKFQR